MKMGIENVNGIDLKPLQTFLDTFLDVLSVGASLRIHICIVCSVDFSGDHNFFSGNFEVLKDFSELDF